MKATSKRMTDIVLIDSQPLFREDIRRILEMEESFRVVGEGDTSDQLVPLYNQHYPQLILTEVHFPGKKDLHALEELIIQVPHAKVVIFTTTTDFDLLEQVLENGASGYLLKEMDSFSLTSALKAVMKGGFFLHPKIARTVVSLLQERNASANSENAHQQTAVRSPYHLLSWREIEVLQLLGEGHSNKRLGELLHISDKTVKNHIAAILRKMGVRDRTQAVVKALKKGWIELK
ncbi:LuxR C-terminal-related transcriptional regulator [Planococcus halotolerans]|uniref:DNA-binding response regulator n=1 Tax=Planococcus halotolerans TaxID=2233542 RepID=A0A365KUH9_9BACL|nr:response regulator transcription factor [Planococcus halotolerans]QHJ71347.1 response regulator [Planococcus halotolerans]RAZ76798.1 DNA-binding response regulator [Planococcus halotolerans]